MNGIGVAGRLFFLRLFGSGSLARDFALLLLLLLWGRERGMPRSELSTAIDARLVLRGRLGRGRFEGLDAPLVGGRCGTDLFWYARDGGLLLRGCCCSKRGRAVMMGVDWVLFLEREQGRVGFRDFRLRAGHSFSLPFESTRIMPPLPPK